MNVSCPECQSVFRVDPAKVPGPGIRARCSICGGLIPITVERSWADDFADVGRARVATPVQKSRRPEEAASVATNATPPSPPDERAVDAVALALDAPAPTSAIEAAPAAPPVAFPAAPVAFPIMAPDAVPS